jgi:hypothetical protein
MSFLIKIHPERDARVILVHVAEEVPLHKSRLLNRVWRDMCLCMHVYMYLYVYACVCVMHLHTYMHMHVA